MTAPIEEGTTVRELAGKFPQTLRVFELFGIDYCCGGDIDLGSAAERAGVELGDLLMTLETAVESSPADEAQQDRDWWAARAVELIEHLVGRHHTFLKSELPRLSDILGKVRGCTRCDTARC